jgi:dihydrofolate reductase
LNKYTSGQLRRPAIKLSVFCGVSVDGFLARPDNALDFLDAGGQEPHGFEEFYGSVDVVVIGRKTFEVVLKFGSWFYGKKPVFVLSSRPLNLSSIKGGVVEQMSGGPAEIVSQLRSRGFKHAYIDGGVTIQRFLAAGCNGDHTRAGTDRCRYSVVWPGTARHQSSSRGYALL